MGFPVTEITSFDCRLLAAAPCVAVDAGGSFVSQANVCFLLKSRLARFLVAKEEDDAFGISKDADGFSDSINRFFSDCFMRLALHLYLFCSTPWWNGLGATRRVCFGLWSFCFFRVRFYSYFDLLFANGFVFEKYT